MLKPICVVALSLLLLACGSDDKKDKSFFGAQFGLNLSEEFEVNHNLSIPQSVQLTEVANPQFDGPLLPNSVIQIAPSPIKPELSFSLGVTEDEVLLFSFSGDQQHKIRVVIGGGPQGSMVFEQQRFAVRFKHSRAYSIHITPVTAPSFAHGADPLEPYFRKTLTIEQLNRQSIPLGEGEGFIGFLSQYKEECESSQATNDIVDISGPERSWVLLDYEKGSVRDLNFPLIYGFEEVPVYFVSNGRFLQNYVEHAQDQTIESSIAAHIRFFDEIQPDGSSLPMISVKSEFSSQSQEELCSHSLTATGEILAQ